MPSFLRIAVRAVSSMLNTCTLIRKVINDFAKPGAVVLIGVWWSGKNLIFELAKRELTGRKPNYEFIRGIWAEDLGLHEPLLWPSREILPFSNQYQYPINIDSLCQYALPH